MKHSETIGEVAAALAEFNAAEISLPKDKSARITPKDSSRYADLGTVIAAVRPALAAAGLSLLQEIVHGERAGELGVSTWILHRSGEWLAFEPVWIGYGAEPKELGIAITYVRRYALMAALSLAPEDDGTPPAGKGAPVAGPGAASNKQLAKIRADVRAAGISAEELTAVLRRYNAGTLEEITKAQASDLIDRIAAEADRRQAAAAAGVDPVTGELPPGSTESAQEPLSAAPAAPEGAEPSDEDPAAYWPEDAGPAENPPGIGAEEFRARTAAAADAPGPKAKHATNPQKAKIAEIERELVAAGAMAEGELDRDLLEKYGVTARSDLTRSEASDVLETLIAASKSAKGGA